MYLTVASNWDHALIERLEGMPIADLYGKVAADAVGGGRPSYGLQARSRRHMAEHIGLARQQGWGFTYLMNAACMDNRELTRSGFGSFLAEVEWAVQAGATGVTVALPFLAGVLREHFPEIELHVSCYAGVESLTTVRFWDELGASRVTLGTVEITRDFAFLRQVSSVMKAQPQLIVNNACLSHCPFGRSHPQFLAHASQAGHRSGGFGVDYSRLQCSYRKIRSPLELLQSDWIRPEDLSLYEALGIEHFKIVDRCLPTDSLVSIVQAYAARRFDGNLLDLTPHRAPVTVTSKAAQLVKIGRFFFKPWFANPKKLEALSLMGEPFEIVIDNRALDGFLAGIMDIPCRERDCARCGYCQDWADRVVQVDQAWRERMLERYGKLFELLHGGGLFRYWG